MQKLSKVSKAKYHGFTSAFLNFSSLNESKSVIASKIFSQNARGFVYYNKPGVNN